MVNIEQIQSFFNEFRQLEQNYWVERFKKEKQHFEAFKANYQPFKEELDNILLNESPYYNVFDVLNIRQYEEKLHTPFLCHLLDPKANHEQGAIFLDDFLTRVVGLEYTYKTISNFEIHEELVTTYGRIDLIMLFNTSKSNKKAIVIENKIYAGDQKKQLERYYNYVTKTLDIKSGDFRLIYLSPKGEPPTSDSINPELAKSLVESGQLVAKSYEQNIIPWLFACLTYIKSDRVKFITQQYIDVLGQL